MGKAVMGFQPPSRPVSSLMTGEVSVIVTCISGSVQDVRMMAASWIDPFTSYFSGVTTWKKRCKSKCNVRRHFHQYSSAVWKLDQWFLTRNPIFKHFVHCRQSDCLWAQYVNTGDFSSPTVCMRPSTFGINICSEGSNRKTSACLN